MFCRSANRAPATGKERDKCVTGIANIGLQADFQSALFPPKKSRAGFPGM
jgi:hypothetical protein